jgi:heme O synthase-like polyprenyltransferase
LPNPKHNEEESNTLIGFSNILMMNPETPRPTETVELSPSYSLAIAVVLLGAAIVLLQLWVGAVVALFGGFLLLHSQLSLR